MISVIVPARDPEAGLLTRALESVRQTLDPVEIVVVDDGSSIAISAPEATVIIRTDGVGPGAARNCGALAATGDWLVFLDADDELLEGAVDMARMTTVQPAGTALVCAGALVERNGIARASLPLGCEGLPGAPRISLLAGTFAVARKVFNAVGGYDPDLRFGENSDLVIRCAAIGSVAAIDSTAMCYHAGPHERRYDERRFHGAVHVLERGRADLAHAPTRSRLHAIAAVNASRTGMHGHAIRHAWLAALARPTSRNLVRLLFTCTGPVTGWWWRRAQAGAP